MVDTNRPFSSIFNYSEVTDLAYYTCSPSGFSCIIQSYSSKPLCIHFLCRHKLTDGGFDFSALQRWFPVNICGIYCTLRSALIYSIIIIGARHGCPSSLMRTEHSFVCTLLRCLGVWDYLEQQFLW